MPLQIGEIEMYNCPRCGAVLRKRWVADQFVSGHAHWVEMQEHDCIEYLSSRIDNLVEQIGQLMYGGDE